MVLSLFRVKDRRSSHATRATVQIADINQCAVGIDLEGRRRIPNVAPTRTRTA
jgi:hypothetical protein